MRWDPAKNAANKAKHGFSFEEASSLLLGGMDYLEIYDEASSIDEERFLAIGPIASGIVVVVFTERADDVIRIISARRATTREARLFRENTERKK